MRELIAERIVRGSECAPCTCGGYADVLHDDTPTQEEISAYDCGRPYACCTSAYQCRVCGKQFIAKQETPDMDIF